MAEGPRGSTPNPLGRPENMRFDVHPLKALLVAPPLLSLGLIALSVIASPWMKAPYLCALAVLWLRATKARVETTSDGVSIRPYYLTFDNADRTFRWDEITDLVVLDSVIAWHRRLEIRSGQRSARIALGALHDPDEVLRALRSGAPSASAAP